MVKLALIIANAGSGFPEGTISQIKGNFILDPFYILLHFPTMRSEAVHEANGITLKKDLRFSRVQGELFYTYIYVIEG